MKTIFLSVVASVVFMASQSQCRDAHMFCSKSSKLWQFNSQSTSGMVEFGEPSVYTVTVYGGVDYRFAFCSDDPNVNGKLQIRIWEEEVKMVDDPKLGRKVRVKQDIMRFNNAEKEMVQEWDFTSSTTRKLFVEVIIPEDGASAAGGKKGVKVSDYACVGLLIQHMKGTKTGFGGNANFSGNRSANAN
jgi:hypothetical protein